MEHFVTLERAIACPRASVAVAAETAAQVLGGCGYRRGLGFGPTASYVRAYRPGWVVAVALVGAIPTFGLALFLLRYRVKDHCNVVIEDGPYGVVALVSGRVPASLPAALEAASGQFVEPQQHGGYQQSPPPMLLSPSPGQEGSPSHTPQAILRPATPVPPMGAGQGGQGQGGYGQSGYGQSGQGYRQDGGYPNYGPPEQSGQQPGWQQPGQQQPSQYPGGPQGPGPAPYPGPSFDPYPVPQYGQQPGQYPGQSGGGQHGGGQQGGGQQGGGTPVPPEHGMPGGPVRPPSKLGPPMPPLDPAREGQRAGAKGSGAGGSGSGSAPGGSGPDEEGFVSTSGRVPWVGGGRPGPLPAPPGPPPVSPISRPPGFPPAAPAQQPADPGSPYPPSGAPGGPGGQPAAAPGRVATAVSDASPVLRVDNGELLELGPFCLLGREPVAREGDPPAQLVRFDDSKLSVSKTHLAYGIDQQGVWVMDRNSTNGTTIIDPSGRRITCTPGHRQYIGLGFQVQIGQRRITVEAPGSGPT